MQFFIQLYFKYTSQIFFTDTLTFISVSRPGTLNYEELLFLICTECVKFLGVEPKSPSSFTSCTYNSCLSVLRMTSVLLQSVVQSTNEHNLFRHPQSDDIRLL